eukprot:CAMPEP_0179157082 /NCGR_PEP_ID=MMETSP0796-20121207/76605_1 /TAXON_ID=73915 /ORGANISM="Pyrodinium bahamense, Strain pbaha01" /LENGTH=34 /DNA_ID= /DNA_START= /DNA_END= /DNA_ORIENTATION=
MGSSMYTQFLMKIVAAASAFFCLKMPAAAFRNFT